MCEDERRTLLFGYMQTEPEIECNCLRYAVSVSFQERDYVDFYATGLQGVGAIARVKRSSWDSCDCGLSMAYLYNTVLGTLELGVSQTGGRLE